MLTAQNQCWHNWKWKSLHKRYCYLSNPFPTKNFIVSLLFWIKPAVSNSTLTKVNRNVSLFFTYRTCQFELRLLKSLNAYSCLFVLIRAYLWVWWSKDITTNDIFKKYTLGCVMNRIKSHFLEKRDILIRGSKGL